MATIIGTMLGTLAGLCGITMGHFIFGPLVIDREKDLFFRKDVGRALLVVTGIYGFVFFAIYMVAITTR